MTNNASQLHAALTKALQESFSYDEYRALSVSLFAEGKTTSAENTPALLDYTKLNLQRMLRWEKTAEVSSEILDALQRPFAPYTWLILTESWCGDAAQNIPMLHKIAEASNGKISMRLTLRDHQLTLMDMFLTHGSRAIPKLLCLDAALNVVATWGARPAVLQQMVSDNAALPEGERLLKPALSEKIHAWYAKDKHTALQQEFVALIQGLS